MAADTTKLSVVLGAGPVGRALVTRLSEGRRPVRAATRSGNAAAPAGVEVIAADISNPEEAARACEGASVAYSCVGLDYTGWPERWPPMMAGMLAGAEAAGARFVFMDNLYMYGPVEEPMREDMPLTDYGRKPAALARVTRMWQEAHEAGRVRAAAVRASDFYGPGATQAVLDDETFARIVQGTTWLADKISYRNNLHRAIVRADADLQELFAEATRGRRATKAADAPELDARGPRHLNGNLREVPEMLYQWERPFRVDHSKFASRFWETPRPSRTASPLPPRGTGRTLPRRRAVGDSIAALPSGQGLAAGSASTVVCGFGCERRTSPSHHVALQAAKV